MQPTMPKQTLDDLATWGTAHLEAVIAIDSQSDEKSPTVPSTEGQRVLAEYLKGFFEGLGYAAHQDASANLLVTIESNVERDVPHVAFMVHTDTAEGTNAVESLERVPAWDGSKVCYPANDRLSVSTEGYPATRDFLGEDLLHGPGDAPVGLDDKLGMCELMTLARVLKENPDIEHGPLTLVFRPDEEIGRMEAIEGLADALKAGDVTYGYTVDGIAGFEINTENFNAARARVRVPASPVGAASAIALRIDGVKSHGATAKAEGYLNASLIFARAMAGLPTDGSIEPIGYESDPLCETSADVVFQVADAAAEEVLLAALRAQIADATWRGAAIEVTARSARAGASGLRDVAAHLNAFLASDGPVPRLSEDSEIREGYSNPYFITSADGAWTVDYRLRDFDRDALTAREDHVRRVAGGLEVEIEQQYINMGPALADFPMLVEWALAALPEGAEPRTYPIRGGTGVDPFLARGIPVANLGTGYFAPESEKELTSRQSIARHSLWLTTLVQVIAGPSIR